MKRILILLSITLFAACRKDDMAVPGPSPENGEIQIAATTAPATRGTITYYPSEIKDLGVFAYYTGSSTWDVAVAEAVKPLPNVMDNTTVIHTVNLDNTNGGGNIISETWATAVPVYWYASSTAKYSFFAYSPTSAGAYNETSNPTGNGITVTNTSGVPKIRYKVPENCENQPDLMIATPKKDINKSSSPIYFELKHALTCINIKAKGQGEVVTGARIEGVVNSAEISLDGGGVELDAVATTRFPAVINGQPRLESYATPILSANGNLMMIPQTLTADAKLILTISVNNYEYDLEYPLNSVAGGKWTAGDYISYVVTVKKEYDILLSPSTIILPYSASVASSFRVLCGSGVPWTVHAPADGTAGDWLRLSTNINCTNSAASISGTGPATLYAFSTDESGRDVREAQILCPASGNIPDGGTGTANVSISVTQLGDAPDDYYIPAEQKGWAGSNIYWDGTKLTFDDVGVRTHENYQGLYFMWGSLVATSPVGDWSTNVEMPGGVPVRADYGVPRVIYDPTSNNGVYADWSKIPRAGWNDTAPGEGLPLSLGGNETTEDYRQRAYIYRVHDKDKGIGDICKHITDMGWAPGSEFGVKWRMPTSKEFEPATAYQIKGSPTPLVVPDTPEGHAGRTPIDNGYNRHGVYFPFSGARTNYYFGILWEVGKNGYYWPASPYEEGCYYLLLNGSGSVAPFHFYWSDAPSHMKARATNRPDAYTVRCVRD